MIASVGCRVSWSNTVYAGFVPGPASACRCGLLWYLHLHAR
ncbi:hypothetical protein YT1_1818 [Rhodococcus ruber]|nr:hypothetical protein YT1_1818 [Rhodococcus ruber]